MCFKGGDHVLPLHWVALCLHWAAHTVEAAPSPASTRGSTLGGLPTLLACCTHVMHLGFMAAGVPPQPN